MYILLLNVYIVWCVLLGENGVENLVKWLVFNVVNLLFIFISDDKLVGDKVW